MQQVQARRQACCPIEQGPPGLGEHFEQSGQLQPSRGPGPAQLDQVHRQEQQQDSGAEGQAAGRPGPPAIVPP